MPISPSSRYADRPVHIVAGPDGRPRKVVALRLEREAAPPRTSRYQVRQKDTPDLLARRFLGDERLWWRLLDANPPRTDLDARRKNMLEGKDTPWGTILYPLDLRAGDRLEVPRAAAATRITRARKF